MLQDVLPGLYVEQFLPGIWSGESKGWQQCWNWSTVYFSPSTAILSVHFFVVYPDGSESMYIGYTTYLGPKHCLLTWFQFNNLQPLSIIGWVPPPKKNLFLKKMSQFQTLLKFCQQKKHDFCESIHHHIIQSLQPEFWKVAATEDLRLG